jgi:hypothetical protein
VPALGLIVVRAASAYSGCGEGGDEGVSIGAGLLSVAAAARRASCKRGGNSLPRFAARRRIPAQALALKKYRCGTSPVSKMSDNEQALAPLGNPEVLSVQDSPGVPIPEFFQPSEEGSKVPSAARRQDTGDVLPDHPLGPQVTSNSKKLKGQVATRVIHSCSESGDAEGLAGRSGAEKVNWSMLGSYVCHVPQIRHLGEVVTADRVAVRVNLRQEDTLPG